MSLNLKELARELDDLRERTDDGEALDGDDLARIHDLGNLEKYLGDLHVASRNVTLLTEDEHAAHVQDQYEDIPPNIAIHVDWKAVAADDLTDWTAIEFDGETYYTRDA